MNLENDIVELLKTKHPLKAKEIASYLGNGITTTEINSILYKNLKGKVIQDSNYRWSLNQSKTSEITDDSPKIQDTPLAKLASYYLECISKDIDSGISEFASSKFGNLEYSQLSFIPNLDSEKETYDLEPISGLINKVRRDKNRLVLKLGYPIFLRKFISKSGNPFFKVEPLYLLSIDTEQLIYSNALKFTDEDPEINPEMLRNTLGVNGSELLQEILLLNDELGINNIDDKPSIDDLAQRLEQIRPDWEWKEEINPFQLSTTKLSETNIQGIYNNCAAFVSERSQYTVGLEKELIDLTKLPENEYCKSALGHWIDNSIDSPTISDEPLLVPLSLNEEQREAVLRGLSASLTVVTGPPGTGKSQVVANLLINAVFQGQKVLFASKNHKAVDVVFERVNGLTSRPVMLRLGNSELQATLATYLTNLLSSKTTETDSLRYNETKLKHERLTKQIIELRKKQESIVLKRNKIDELERNLENLRSSIGNELFQSFNKINLSVLDNSKYYINAFRNKLLAADKSKQSLFIKLFWNFCKKERFDNADKEYNRFKEEIKILGIKFPELNINDSNIETFYSLIQQGNEWLSNITKIKEYFLELESLSKIESLFQLTLKDKDLTEEISDNSIELWQNWLQLLPDTLTPANRKTIGDYTTLLNLIVKADGENQQLDRGIWAKYYKLLPEITNILSCWAVTSLSVRSRVPFQAGFFDLVVIDEASQCDIASALPLIFRAKRAVIIGDDKQLTHISSINNTQDIHLLEKYTLDENYLGWSYSGTSLYRLASSLCNSNDIVVLRDHHRSHADIINYSNKYFYQGNLRIATKYENLKSLDKDQVVRWINVNGKVIKPSTGGSLNELEAKAVVNELKRIINTGYSGTIGVVSPFRAQANRIRDLVYQDQELLDRLLLRQFLVDTVHKFQGDERDVMIFSTVIGQDISKGSLLFLSRTGNLFNVAITRARAALVIIGDINSCLNSQVEHFVKFVEYVKRLSDKSSINTEKEKIDFGPKYPPVTKNVIVSDWEKLFYEALYKEGIITIPQYQVGQYILDLALIKGEKRLNIEIDGEKYHRNWDGELLKRDQLRNKRLIELGWDVQRFWVYQIRDDLKNSIIKVKSWIE